jgi:hypothetical protein
MRTYAKDEITEAKINKLSTVVQSGEKRKRDKKQNENMDR